MVVARLLLVACFAAGVLVAPARAEMPQNHAAPEIGGGIAVGEVVLGHNGTWLYADGSGCGPECSLVQVGALLGGPVRNGLHEPRLPPDARRSRP